MKTMGELDGLPSEKFDVLKALETDAPPLDFVLPGLLAGSVGMLSGPSGIGKSMLAMQLAIDVASGENTTGLNKSADRAERVVLLNALDADVVIKHRRHLMLRKICANQQSIANACSNLRIASRRQLGWECADITSPQGMESVKRRAEGARLVILDDLGSFHTLDVAKHKDATRLMRALEETCAECQTTMLVVHRHYSGQADPLETYPRMEMSLAQPSQADLMERGIKDGEQRRHVVLSSDGRDFDLDLLTQKERWFWRGDNGLLEPAVLI